ncbi:monocarboxylate transporter 12-like [Amphibalanus amphitrite]|uniref:monocarboxylate transporter 12-like n=1 Tax=Amphibalanus amphitrite TaxID=1232801 RepID=UPI001C8FE6E9|nr:monocarboxylate transporter 12-like [Amphibalanus amphitrite]
MVSTDLSSAPRSRPGSAAGEELSPTVDSSDEHQSTIGSLPPSAPLRLDIRRARQTSTGEASSVAGSVVFASSLGDELRGADAPPPVSDGAVQLDGGYGWLVAFGAFLANLCVAGTIKSFGLISIQIQLAFNVTAAEMGVVTGIMLTAGLLLSPVVGALCQKYTCRRVAIFGGLLCFLGFSLSSLATSVTQFALTIGLLVGVGSGCVSTSAILIATRYFPRRRSLINGLVLAGNAAGGFALPPLLQHLLAEYGVRGTLLITGALCLHVVVGAALFRPIALHERILRQRRPNQIRESDGDPAQGPVQGAESTPLVEREKGSVARGTGSCSPDSASASGEFRFPAASPFGRRTRTVSESLWSERRRSSQRSPAVGTLRRGTIAVSRPRLLEVAGARGPAEVPRRLRTSSLMLSVADVTVDATTQLEDEERQRKGAPGPLASLRRLLDLKLLANPLFLMEAAAVFLMASGTPYALLQLPAFGVSRGISTDQTAHMLMIASALDLVTRLSFGWVLDQNYFRRQYALAASQLLSGSMVLAMPLSHQYSVITGLCLVFAVGMGTWFINLAPVLADNHGIERVAASYGLVRMFHGLSSLIMPPIFGALVDGTGDHGSQFFAMGSLMLFGGLLVLLTLLTGMDKKYGEGDADEHQTQKSKAEGKAGKV